MLETTEKSDFRGGLKLLWKKKKDSICIKLAETDEELCGRGYVHVLHGRKLIEVLFVTDILIR